jgi:hypothetical protein
MDLVAIGSPSLCAGIFLRSIHLQIVSGLTPKCVVICSITSVLS